MDTFDLAPSPLLDAHHRYRVVLRLALPTVFAMLSQTCVNVVDDIFFGHLPIPGSSYAKAALLPSLIVTWLFGGSLSAISVGTQALVGRRFAEGHRHAAGAVMASATIFGVVAGAVFSVIGLAAMPTILRIIVHVPQVQEVAIDYTRWRLLAVVSMAATAAMKAFFDGIGRTQVHFFAAIVMNVVNISLCWVFVLGHLGAPVMGAPGAGMSAFIATWVGLGVMVAFAWAARDEYRFARWANVSRSTVWSILKLSIPAALVIITMMGGFGIFTRNVGQLDEGVVGETVNSAATGDIVQILMITFTACMAFGTSAATLISQSLGRRDPDEAQRWGWASVRLGVVVFGVVGLCEGLLFTHQIVGIFGKSFAVQAAEILPLRIMGAATPLIAMAMILSEGLFGAGATVFVAIAQGILIFLVLLPVSWLLGLKLGFGLRGVWFAAFLYATLASIVIGGWFARGSWKKIRL